MVREDKIRVMVTMSKELREQLKEIAAEQDRHYTGMITSILKQYVKDYYSNKTSN